MELEILATCRRLAKHPLMGSKRRDITSRPVRFWSVEKQGSTIGHLDQLLAGTAVSRGAALVTNNAAEFARVPGAAGAGLEIRIIGLP